MLSLSQGILFLYSPSSTFTGAPLGVGKSLKIATSLLVGESEAIPEDLDGLGQRLKPKSTMIDSNLGIS